MLKNNKNRRGIVNFKQLLKTSNNGLSAKTGPAVDYSKIPVTSFSPAVQRYDHSETIVNITKYHYENVISKILCSSYNTGYLLAGPTGCGKTTYALNELLQYKPSMLIICPSAVNCMNVCNEFNFLMPRQVKYPKIVPPVAYADPGMKSISFITCTNVMFNDYVRAHGKLPDYRYIVHDEFHILTPENVLTLTLLRNLELKRGKYILASATPPGMSIPPRVMGNDLLFVNVKVPDPLVVKDIGPTIFNPYWHRYTGRRVIVVAVASTVASDHLAAMLGDTTVVQVDDRTNPEDFQRTLRDVRPDDYFIITPEVQAGITIPMDVFIMTGLTVSKDYDGKVLMTNPRNLTKSEYTQAFGRAARIRPTIVYADQDKICSDNAVSPLFYEANAAVLLKALCIDLDKSSVAAVKKTFPKVFKINDKAAARCVSIRPQDPLMAAFMVDQVGDLYDFAGGSARTFVKDNIDDLSMYFAKDRTLIAPFVDLTVDNDPSAWLPRARQQEMSEAIAATKAVKVPDELLPLVDLLVEDLPTYASDFLDVFAYVNDGSKFATFSYKDSECVGKSDYSLKAMSDFDIKTYYGDLVATMFVKLAPLGVVTKIEKVVVKDLMIDFKDDVTGKYSPHPGLKVNCAATVEFCGRVENFVVGRSDCLKADKTYDKHKIEALFVKKLKAILATLWLRKHGGDAVVSLETYANQAAAAKHRWLIGALS